MSRPEVVKKIWEIVKTRNLRVCHSYCSSRDYKNKWLWNESLTLTLMLFRRILKMGDTPFVMSSCKAFLVCPEFLNISLKYE